MLSERRYGTFERRVPLPSDIDAKVSAKFSKGVLEIALPKDERPVGRARRIDVKNA